jgi:ACS family glucarate transporter-like MFS transporter
LCAITVVNYIQRNSIGGMVEPIVHDLNTSDEAIGFSGTAFFLTYALMQIPTGLLAQRWGARRALPVYAAGWSLTTAGMGMVADVWGFIGFRGLMGALQAGIFPAATLVMSAWLPSSQRAFASALLNSCMLIGGALVNNLTAEAMLPKGPLTWRQLLSVYAAPGILWAIWFAWWFRNTPEEHPRVNQAERQTIAAGRAGPNVMRTAASWSVLLTLALWLICAQQFLRAGGSRFMDQWLARYFERVPLRLESDDKVRLATAKHYSTIPQYAGVVGGLIGGALSDAVLRRTQSRWLARNGVAAGSLFVGSLAFLPIFGLNDPLAQVVFLTIGYFLVTVAAPCAYALTMDLGGPNLPVVFGAMNMVGNFGAAAVTGVVPWLNRLTPDTWTASLAMLVAIHALAGVLWLILDSRRSLGTHETPPDPTTR